MKYDIIFPPRNYEFDLEIRNLPYYENLSMEAKAIVKCRIALSAYKHLNPDDIAAFVKSEISTTNKDVYSGISDEVIADAEFLFSKDMCASISPATVALNQEPLSFVRDVFTYFDTYVEAGVDTLPAHLEKLTSVDFDVLCDFLVGIGQLLKDTSFNDFTQASIEASPSFFKDIEAAPIEIECGASTTFTLATLRELYALDDLTVSDIDDSTLADLYYLERS